MLSKRLAVALDISVPEAQKIIKAFKSCLQEELKDERRVQLIGFGTLRIKERKARIGRNPQTGKEIKILTQKTITFKISPKAKQVMNEKRVAKKKG